MVNNNFHEKLEIGDNKLDEGRSSRRRCSVKRGILEISENSQENSCVRASFFKKSQLDFHLFYRTLPEDCFCGGLALSFPKTQYQLRITDLPSNSNISYTVTVNGTFTSKFSKEYSINFLTMTRLIASTIVFF